MIFSKLIFFDCPQRIAAHPLANPCLSTNPSSQTPQPAIPPTAVLGGTEIYVQPESMKDDEFSNILAGVRKTCYSNWENNYHTGTNMKRIHFSQQYLWVTLIIFFSIGTCTKEYHNWCGRIKRIIPIKRSISVHSDGLIRFLDLVDQLLPPLYLMNWWWETSLDDTMSVTSLDESN